MNVQSKTIETFMPADADAFLRWNEGREGKRKFVRGKVVEMKIDTTRNHARIAARLLMAIGRQLDIAKFDVGSADFAVRTPDGVRYPDVYVKRRGSGSKGTDLAASDPVLLAEVLSASSYGRDFASKLSDYGGVPSVACYLILSQEEPRVWLWSRKETGSWDDGLEIDGVDQAIQVPGLGLLIPLAELYAGMDSAGR